MPPQATNSEVFQMWMIEKACFDTEAHPLEYFSALLECSLVIAAYDNDNFTNMVGFITGRLFLDVNFHTMFYVNYLEISPKFQRLGIGKELLIRLEAALQEAGITSIFLNCRQEVSGFYLTHGYRICGNHKDHLYEKELGEWTHEDTEI
jgi:ribosomal protein S18 acetylase RimI-like enzyme